MNAAHNECNGMNANIVIAQSAAQILWCAYCTWSARGMTRMSFRKVSHEAFVFLYFREIRKNRSHRPGGQSAPRLCNRYNLCPCARPAHVGECGPGPDFKFSQTVQVGWSC